MNRRIAAFGFAVALLAAPLAGVAAADACGDCCPKVAAAACESHAAACPSLAASRAATACCDASPVAPAPESKRQLEAPLVHLSLPAAHSCAPVAQLALTVPVAAAVAWLTSPLRLSVVLLI